jgi:hypothetical protein
MDSLSGADKIKEALMGEEQLNEQLEDQKPVPLSQSLGFGAGTFLTVGAVDLLAHLGPTGLVVGGILAYVAAKHGPELASQAKEAFPQSHPGNQESRRHGGTGAEASSTAR